MNLILETNRLILRPFQNGDIQQFAEYRSDPNIAKYQSWNTPFSLEKAAQLVAGSKPIYPSTPGGWHQIAIELKDGGDFIGDCVFHILPDDARQAEIGFTLARAYHGQGYATEAVTKLVDYLFGELQLHRIRATCDVENVASAKLLERVGMRREAHFIENIWFKGKWGSEYAYGLLRREWIKIPSLSE
jgi:RimJ/RimL family protein N-acetyltransferase